MAKLTNKIMPILLSITFLSGCSAKTSKVSFYSENVLYTTQDVKVGECAVEPEKPTKLDREFQYWCTDQTLNTKYDFSTPVNSDISLYAKFTWGDVFNEYNDKYQPSNTPFTTDNHFVEGDENVTIVIKSDGVGMNVSISKEQVRFSGAFEDLTVERIINQNGIISFETKGKVKLGKGYVILARSTNEKGIYITIPFEVNEKVVPMVMMDKSKQLLNIKDSLIYFTVKSENQKISNPNQLTADEYLAKLKDAEQPESQYFTITEDEKFALEILKVHEDFTGVDMKVDYNGDFNDEAFDYIKNNLKLHVSEQVFEDGKPYEFGFDLKSPEIKSEVLLTPMKENSYLGYYKIHINGGRFSNALKTNIVRLLEDPVNKNLFFSIPEASVIVRTINFTNDFEVHGKVEIISDAPLGDVSVSLDKIMINEEEINPVINLLNDNVVSVEHSLAEVQIGYDTSTTGTIDQDLASNYGGVKSYIQDFTTKDEDTFIDDLITIGTSIGKFAYGVYSGDYAMAGDGVGKVFGIDALRNPALLMLERLQGVMDKLQEIENKIQQLGEQIEELKKQLEELGKSAYLQTFLQAHSIWSSFKSDYFAPMISEISNYTTAYYLYYYNFAMDSHPEMHKEASITIYYNQSGKVVFPADNGIYSVDGEIIDKSKTKKFVFPELEHTLAGIRHHDGHSYREIENDFIADLVSYHVYSDEEIAEILKTLTFNAMKSYFKDQQTIDQFVNTFKNFCYALTAEDIVSSISISPLECFYLMLRTIYNFGFEIEPDMNLVAIRLTTTFYAAKKIFDFVRIINPGDIDISVYEALFTEVKNELTSGRFYKSNQEDGSVYCFASDCYVYAGTHSYAYHFGHGPEDKGYPDDVYVKKIIVDDLQNYNAEKLTEFTSITKEHIEVMKLKVFVYNVIKNTNYSFKGYLFKIGLIPEELYDTTWGVLTKIDGTVSGKDVYKLTLPIETIYKVSYKYQGAEPHIWLDDEDKLEDYVYKSGALFCEGIKGEWVDFESDKTYTNVACFASIKQRDAYWNYNNNSQFAFFGSGANLFWNWDHYINNMVAWTNYVSFCPVPTNP